MKARASMSHRTGLSGLGLVATLLLLLAPSVAHAQPDDAAVAKAAAADEDEEEEPATATPKPAAKADAPASAPASTGPAATAPVAATSDDEKTAVQADDQLEHANGFVRADAKTTMQWHGGLEADSTYAHYSIVGPTTKRPRMS